MKLLEGKVVSIGMEKTVVVAVVRRTPHPLYKKLIKRSKKFKADSGDKSPAIGDIVYMQETRPMAHGKHFKLVEAIKK